MRQIDCRVNRRASRDARDVALPLSGQPQPCNNASPEINEGAVQPRHSCVGVEHHFLTVRCWRLTSASGRPRKTSDGRYRRSSPQSGHSTVMDWNGNSLTPDGMSRRQRLHVTTKVLRPEGVGNMETV